MAEILYKYLSKETKTLDSEHNIKWLNKDELHTFNEHLKLCGQAVIDSAVWDDIFEEGTSYAGLFIDGKMVARACVEKYSDTYWEVGDVRVVTDYRNRGYAHEICAFVLNHIVLQQKIPTMRTEEKNIIMQKVIEDLGFVQSE